MFKILMIMNPLVRCCLIKYFYLPDHNPKRITNVDKLNREKIDFKDIKLPVKVRDVQNFGKENSIGINVFCYQSMCQKNVAKINMLISC